jgi:hypothetical protein
MDDRAERGWVGREIGKVKGRKGKRENRKRKKRKRVEK